MIFNKIFITMKAGILFKNVFRQHLNVNLTKVSAIYQIIARLSHTFRKKLFKKRVIFQFWLQAFQPSIFSPLVQRGK